MWKWQWLVYVNVILFGLECLGVFIVSWNMPDGINFFCRKDAGGPYWMSYLGACFAIHMVMSLMTCLIIGSVHGQKQSNQK
ncbi:MAG: hypothetical protein HW401_128 [Parcubacteria group bacterium]|nr:hypothetical protein [Parcubacteria group bacterium]